MGVISMLNLIKELKELACIPNNAIVGYCYVIADSPTLMPDLPIYMFTRAKCTKCGKECNQDIDETLVPFMEVMVDGFKKAVERRLKNLRELGFVNLHEIDRKRKFNGDVWVQYATENEL